MDDKRALVVVANDGTTAEISVPPGEHSVVVKKGDVTVRGEKVTISSGASAQLMWRSSTRRMSSREAA